MGHPVATPIYTQFKCIHCYKCAIPFWVPEIFDQERHRLKDGFYCPAGHSQVYTTSDEDRLRKMLEEANSRNTRLVGDLTTTQLEKEKLERKLKRVGRGVCPECNRSFANLARHMNCKHKAT